MSGARREFFSLRFWSFIALILICRPLLGQESPPVSQTPAFSATIDNSSTTPSFATTPGFSSTSGANRTTPAKKALPPLEDFKLKPLDWSRWSVGLLVGVYHPSLDSLNRILSDNNVGILQDPNFLLPGNPDFPTTKRNIIMPQIFGLAQYGVEAQLELNPKYSFTFAFATWTGESRAEDSATIFTRSNQPPSIVPRDARYNVQINQFWWGLRYHFFNEPARKKFYLNIGILGISSAYLTMDSLERVITNNNLSFDSVSVTEASGFGFSTRFGAGGEYHLQKYLSIGVNANYVIGRINTLTVTRFFSNGFGEPAPTQPDSLPPNPTPIPQPVNNPQPGDSVTFAQMKTVGGADYVGPAQNVTLELDGFDVTFYIQFHF